MPTTPSKGDLLRDRGIKRAIDNANATCTNWGEKALNYLRHFPNTQFRTEEVRTWAHALGLPHPPHPRAWGAVALKAQRLKLIRFLGYGRVDNPRAHKTPACIWERT